MLVNLVRRKMVKIKKTNDIFQTIPFVYVVLLIFDSLTTVITHSGNPQGTWVKL